MRPLTIHWLRSVFEVLNGSCLASLLRSLSSLGVFFRDLSVLHKHIFFLGTCNFLSIDQLKNDETGFYMFTCTFAKLKFGGKPCAVKTSIDGLSANAPVDNPLASQRVCSAEWLLYGEPFKEYIFSWSHLQRSFCPL
jgi:hypothetical protein